MGKIISNICTSFLAVFLLSACSTMEYVDNTTLDEGGIPNTATLIEDTDTGNSLKRFGALRVKDSEKSKEDWQVFLLKREGKRYEAETLLYDETSKEDHNFKRAYFSFGAEPSTRAVGIRFRFVY